MNDVNGGYLRGSITTLIVHPKAAQHSTFLVGINNLNTVLGSYKDSNGLWHNLKRRSDGTRSVPNFPGAKTTSATGFNDNGVVVGWYVLPSDASRVTHGYIYRNGSFATLNYRNQITSTSLVGISNNGVVAGNHYFADGFLYVNGVFKNIWGARGEHATVRGISANGVNWSSRIPPKSRCISKIRSRLQIPMRPSHQGWNSGPTGILRQYLADNHSCVIVGVQATAARMSQETVVAQGMLARFAQWQGRQPESLAADATYGNGEFLQWLASLTFEVIEPKKFLRKARTLECCRNGEFLQWLASLTFEVIEPKRDLSDAHRKRLANIINKTGRFLGHEGLVAAEQYTYGGAAPD